MTKNFYFFVGFVIDFFLLLQDLAMGLEPFEGLVLEARRKRKNFFGNLAGVKSKNQRCMYARRLKDLLMKIDKAPSMEKESGSKRSLLKKNL